MAKDNVGYVESDPGTAEASTTLDFSQLRVDQLDVTPSGFVAHFRRTLDDSVLNLYDVQAGTYGPADFTVVGNTVGAVAGSLIYDPAAKTVTFVKTGSPLAPDTYTITLRSAINGFKDGEGHLLDGDADGNEGGNYVQTVTVQPTTARVLSLPDFARGPAQAVNVPATASGVPITLSDGADVLGLSFTLDYDAAILTVSDLSLGSTMPPDWSIESNVTSPGHVSVILYGATPLGAGQIVLAAIDATVPSDAPYRSAGILSLNDIAINDGAIAAASDSAVEVAAYVGDASGNGAYGALDAAFIARVSVGRDSGFAAYRMKDPAIIGDTSGDGHLGAIDAAFLARKFVGRVQPQIPDLPSPMPVIASVGPDPTLRLPIVDSASPGSVLALPLTTDGAQGLLAFDLKITYDAALLDVSNSDVVKGSLLGSDWTVVPNVVGGVITVSAYGIDPLPSNDPGNLLQITYHVHGDITSTVTAALDFDAAHCTLNDIDGNLLPLTPVAGSITIVGGAVNETPTLDAIADPAAIDEDTGVQIVNLTGITAGGGESQALQVTATSSNTTLIPNPTVTYTSPDAGGSLAYQPVANQSGTAVITVTVRDAGLDGVLGNDDDGTVSRTFTVTVNAVNDAPTLDAIADPAAIDEDADVQIVNLTGITAGDGESQALQVTATSSNTTLIPNPTVTYMSPDAGGSLAYQPVANQSGTAVITVTVRDAGLDGVLGNDDDGTVSRTFTVTVNAVNDAPTLDAIADPAAIDEDAGVQIVNLTGITAGGGESQALQVTATSSNTALIPNPTVTYTSPDAPGSLSYQPVANQSGTAVITVTVRDAGLDGVLGNDDDGTVSRTFTVTVNAVNDAPTLDAIADPAAIDEDAGLQTVNLTGITAGGGESQALQVTATSSNTTLIPNPTVTYMSPDATGSLSYQPAANQSGTAVITVTVRDAGLDGVLGNDDDGTVSRTFTVTVNAVNDAPTLDAIADPAAIDEDAGVQTVNLTGITAGGGESQALQVTATSSNTALIPEPDRDLHVARRHRLALLPAGGQPERHGSDYGDGTGRRAGRRAGQ